MSELNVSQIKEDKEALSEECKSLEFQLTTERKKVERLVWALSDVTELYCKLINSGDAGFWNPEDDEAIKKAIELLSEIKGEK